ncbi:YARHG domain-containing protein [Flavobacterium sp.]|uniref:YARHG domain-containing protein n=1 Tax=Flavobacterium sp. TaxID=239 RepID=UPI003BC9A950
MSPESSTRLLLLSDIQNLNTWDLKIMRNEIFARHGYIFQTQDMIDYFNQQSWFSKILRCSYFINNNRKKEYCIY